MTIEGQGWRCLHQAKASLGEGLIWDERDGCLYWVDIFGPSVNWFHLASGRTDSWIPPKWISAMAIREKGGFIASCEDGFAYLDPAKGIYEPFCDPRPDALLTRVNDGATDRQGRYWSGTCDNRQWEDSTNTDDAENSGKDFDIRNTGELYRLDPSGSVTTIQRDIVTANGPAFSPDGRTMYFNDSLPLVTWVHDLAEDGTASNQRVFRRYEAHEGFPDGMTVDAEGNIWMAFSGGSMLRRFSPDAVLLEERKLPVTQGLRPAFGGEDYSRLFIISGSFGFTEQMHKEQPLAGALFEILDPGVKGLPEVSFKG